VAIVRNPSIFEMPDSLKNDLVAFKALDLKGTDIELASKLILIPENQQKVANE
jgi:hypothetical protein